MVAIKGLVAEGVVLFRNNTLFGLLGDIREYIDKNEISVGLWDLVIEDNPQELEVCARLIMYVWRGA